MPRLHSIRCAPGIVFICAVGAAAQTAGYEERLSEGQRLREQARFGEARTVFAGLLREVGNNSAGRWFAGEVLDNLGLDEQEAGRHAEARNRL